MTKIFIKVDYAPTLPTSVYKYRHKSFDINFNFYILIPY